MPCAQCCKSPSPTHEADFKTQPHKVPCKYICTLRKKVKDILKFSTYFVRFRELALN